MKISWDSLAINISIHEESLLAEYIPNPVLRIPRQYEEVPIEHIPIDCLAWIHLLEK